MNGSSANVLHLTGVLGDGGVERQLVRSLAAFDRDRFRHFVCCVSSGGVYEQDLRELRVPCRIMARRARFDPLLALQIADLMKRERIDVVHTQGFTANAWGRAAARIAGVGRVIAHEHGTAWTGNAAMRLADRLLYETSEVLLVNSRATRTMLMRRVGVPGDRIRIVYNGVPESEPRPPVRGLREMLNADSQVPVVGAVGRLDTHKGHVFLLRAIPRIWSSVPETRFVFIGSGPLRNSLEKEARELGLLPDPRVVFTGFLREAPALVSELTLLAHPSIREPLGNVIIEAGMAGVPAVASCVDGIPEVVEDGESGLLVDCTESVETARAPGVRPPPPLVIDGRTGNLRPPLGPDPEQFAAAIVELLTDDARRRSMGENARARCRALFGMDRYIRDLEDAYAGRLPAAPPSPLSPAQRPV